MKKFIIVSLILFVVVLGVSNAQTIVEPGDGTLSAAVLAAGDGEVLILKGGGEYTESAMASLPMKIESKTVTIKAEDGYSQRPVLKFPAVPSGVGNERPNVFQLLNASIILEGLEIDGGMADTTQFLPVQEVVSYAPELANTAPLIKITDCYIHDLMWPLGYVVGGGGEYQDLFIGADSCIIRNNLFFKAPKGIQFRYTACNEYFEVSNNTFWHGTRQWLRTDTKNPSNDPVILVDHNTFYSNAHRPMDFAPTESMVTVTNNIIALCEKTYGDNHEGTLRQAILIRSGSNVHVTNNCTYLTAGIDVADTTNVMNNLIEVDPKFATDPGHYPGAEADFTLAEDSPCIGKATDGTAIGDPRWDPNLTFVSRTSNVPGDFALSQNYPNPFNPNTTINFTIAQTNFTRLTVHNSVGQIVETLISETLQPGSYSVNFNGADMPSGLYLYKLNSGNINQVKKMMLLK